MAIFARRKTRARRPGGRTLERRVFHYEVETELAARLRAAGADERAHLYGAVYNELFARVPDHPQHRLAQDAAASARERARSLAVQSAFAAPWLRPGARVLELGAGDARFSVEIASKVGAVFAADVSEAVLHAGGEAFPANVVRVAFDGLRLPLRDASLDVVFSNQLIEHLHPDDAETLLREMFRVLKPGGACLCITPSRVDGPHDISGLFDDVARGFHLKEYTSAELAALAHGVGFGRVRFAIKLGLRFVGCPTALRVAAERLLLRLPRGARRAVGDIRTIRTLLPHYLCAEKPPAS